MDGIPANTIKGKLQHIAAPLCLLYQHPDEGLIPIAIQVDHLHPSCPWTRMKLQGYKVTREMYHHFLEHMGIQGRTTHLNTKNPVNTEKGWEKDKDRKWNVTGHIRVNSAKFYRLKRKHLN